MGGKKVIWFVLLDNFSENKKGKKLGRFYYP